MGYNCNVYNKSKIDIQIKKKKSFKPRGNNRTVGIRYGQATQKREKKRSIHDKMVEISGNQENANKSDNMSPTILVVRMWRNRYSQALLVECNWLYEPNTQMNILLPRQYNFSVSILSPYYIFTQRGK